MKKKTGANDTGEQQSTGLLKRADDNPREMPEERLAGLGVSTETYGDLSGIVWNERSSTLVAGHQRMTVLDRAGAKSWVRVSNGEGYIVDPRTNERFAIRIVDWDQPTEIAARIQANNPELQGEFTDDVVGQLHELEEIAQFEEQRLAALLEDLDPEKDPRERRSLEDFDHTAPAKKRWILIATDEDLAPEIEAELRARYDGQGIRIEVSGGD